MMSVVWIGVLALVGIGVGTLMAVGLLRGAKSVEDVENSLQSSWLKNTICSGDDALGHPDLNKLQEVRNKK